MVAETWTLVTYCKKAHTYLTCTVLLLYSIVRSNSVFSFLMVSCLIYASVQCTFQKSINVPGISLGNHERMEPMSNTDPILKPYKQYIVNFVSKKLDPLTWSEQMHVDHRQATQVKYMLCQANNRLLRYDHCHQPFFLVIVVYSINYVLLTILHNFPHGSTNHVTSCIRCYGQTMAFTCKFFQKKNSGTQYFIKND